MTKTLLPTLFLFLLIPFAVCCQHNTYYVGHSGLGFSQYNLVGYMVDDLAADAGIWTYDFGDQVIGGSCLSTQWEDHALSSTGDSWIDIPAGNGSGPYDILIMTELVPIWEALLPNAWQWGCNLSPYEALDNFHNLATTTPANCSRIYLFEFHNEADFTIPGGSPATYADWSNLNASQRLLYENVADSVTQLNPGGPPVCLVPIAAASQALVDSIIGGSFPGITNWINFFEPTDGMSWKIHNTDITGYLTACVTFATIFGESPVGLTNETAGRTVAGGDAPTPAQALIMQLIAWEIVSNDPRTCLPPVYGTDYQVACNSYTWIDGNTYTSSNNTATHTIIGGAANGRDSIVTLDLTINYNPDGTDIITACNTYTWIDGNTYTSSNNTATYTIFGGATNGCDSLVFLDLTINNSATGTDIIAACNSYTWIDGNTYTTNNSTATYNIIGGAASGCDSLVLLDLTINTVDVGVTYTSPSLTANAAGAGYQWLNCDNNFAAINGETGQSYVVTANGNYAVEVTQNGCTDTSACVNILGIGIDERNLVDLRIYPNPINDFLTIELDDFSEDAELIVSSTEGKIVYSNSTITNNKLLIDAAKWSTGVYLVKLNDKDRTATLKVVKL